MKATTKKKVKVLVNSDIQPVNQGSSEQKRNERKSFASEVVNGIVSLLDDIKTY
jgi:hypothetical protein